MGHTYTLYIDETGIRYPQHTSPPRSDGMDWFGWGGILVKKDDEENIVNQYKEFCTIWRIDYPLHSTAIRGRRAKFSWLQEDSVQAATFFKDFDHFLMKIPVLGFAVVVSRPGYNARYIQRHGPGRWELCKTTYPILLERVVRYLIEHDPGSELRVEFEGSNGADNKKIVQYAKELRDNGHPFDPQSAGKYAPLTSD